jgi:putative transposase
MDKRWKTSRTSVFNLGYHLIWCSKYRRKVLDYEVEAKLKIYLQEKANQLGIEIVSLEVMPDHVRLFVKASPVDAVHWVVGQLKGYTSRKLREEFPFLKSRLPCLWTRSYFCAAVGQISEEAIKAYIEDQKNK